MTTTMKLTTPVRLVAALALAGATLLGAAHPARASLAATMRVTAARLTRAPVGFPGPERGVPGSQTPRATDFVMHCNSSVNGDAGKVGGTTIPAGTAVLATTGCGTAVLILDAPGQGRFQATFGVSDDDTSGKPASVDVRVVGQDGNDLRVSQFTASRGRPSRISVDVTRATAVLLRFLSEPKTFVFAPKLTGSARTLRPAVGNGGALAAGATAVHMASATTRCNAAMATTPLSVTLVGVPTAGTATATSCGEITLGIAPRSPSTLVLRYGASDDSIDASGGRDTLSVKVLDAGGHLLRKVTAVAFIGGGLRPLWVDLSGAHSVVMGVDGSTDTHVAITGVGILPRSLPTYTIPDRTLSAAAAGGSVAIDPVAFVSQCNSGVGGEDITVAHAPVFGGAYFATNECGSTGLLFCCGHTDGMFHARFGVSDTAPGGARPTATVTVKDKDNHVLERLTVHATPGAAGARIDISIRRASVLSFSFGGGSGVLYDLRLTGTAAISELIYPPTVPPVDPAGGSAIDPRRFTTRCNATVADGDQRVVNATALDGWALLGQSCGEADLALTHRAARWHDFSARVGIAIGEAPDTVTTIRFNVLDASGKVIRHKDVPVLYGYGWQPMRMSLAGGSTLQIVWTGALGKIVVFGMTAR